MDGTTLADLLAAYEKSCFFTTSGSYVQKMFPFSNRVAPQLKDHRERMLALIEQALSAGSGEGQDDPLIHFLIGKHAEDMHQIILVAAQTLGVRYLSISSYDLVAFGGIHVEQDTGRVGNRRTRITFGHPASWVIAESLGIYSGSANGPVAHIYGLFRSYDNLTGTWDCFSKKRIGDAIPTQGLDWDKVDKRARPYHLWPAT